MKLVSWKVPENEYTKEEKVTLRRLVSHSAGLTVPGFPGYAAGEEVPSLLQVLDGQKPANSTPLRVDSETTYFSTEADLPVTFIKNDKGEVTEMISSLGGRAWKAKKIK